MKKQLKKELEKTLGLDRAREEKSGGRIVKGRFGDSPASQRDTTGPIAGMAREVNIELINPDPNQPRKTLNPKTITEMANSIKEYGVLQAITVYASDDGSKYFLISGERRLTAAKEAKLKRIPCMIRPKKPEDSDRMQEQLIENIQREDIPPLEEARAVKALMETFSLSHRKLGQRLGKPKTYFQELLGILRIPDELLEKARGLKKQALVEISRINNPIEQAETLKRVLQSPTPYQEAKKARGKKTSGQKKNVFRETYHLDGEPRITLTVQKSPRTFKSKQLIPLLKKVVRGLEKGEL